MTLNQTTIEVAMKVDGSGAVIKTDFEPKYSGMAWRKEFVVALGRVTGVGVTIVKSVYKLSGPEDSVETLKNTFNNCSTAIVAEGLKLFKVDGTKKRPEHEAILAAEEIAFMADFPDHASYVKGEAAPVPAKPAPKPQPKRDTPAESKKASAAPSPSPAPTPVVDEDEDGIGVRRVIKMTFDENGYYTDPQGLVWNRNGYVGIRDEVKF